MPITVVIQWKDSARRGRARALPAGHAGGGWHAPAVTDVRLGWWATRPRAQRRCGRPRVRRRSVGGRGEYAALPGASDAGPRAYGDHRGNAGPGLRDEQSRCRVGPECLPKRSRHSPSPAPGTVIAGRRAHRCRTAIPAASHASGLAVRRPTVEPRGVRGPRSSAASASRPIDLQRLPRPDNPSSATAARLAAAAPQAALADQLKRIEHRARRRPANSSSARSPPDRGGAEPRACLNLRDR